MATNIEIKFYEFLEGVNSLLNREIFNKPIKEWLLLIIKYSFVLWLAIIGYIVFSYYQQISEVNEAIKTKQSFLKSKKFQRKKLILKLKDINKAYRLAYKYFNKNKEKLNNLRKKIDTLYIKVLSQKQTNYVVVPIQFESFNYKLNISHAILHNIKLVSIDDIKFSSITSDYFFHFLLKNANKVFDSQKKIDMKLSISVEQNNLSNFILLAKKSSAGIIKIYTSVNYPFTMNIYKYNYIAVAFVPFEALRNSEAYSPLLIKWQFTVREENK